MMLCGYKGMMWERGSERLWMRSPAECPAIGAGERLEVVGLHGFSCESYIGSTAPRPLESPVDCTYSIGLNTLTALNLLELATHPRFLVATGELSATE